MLLLATSACATRSSIDIVSKVNAAVDSATLLAKRELAHIQNELLNDDYLTPLFVATVESTLDDAVETAANFSQVSFFSDTEVAIATPTSELVESPLFQVSTSPPYNDEGWLEEVEAKAELIDKSSEVAEEMIEAALTALDELKNQSASSFDQVAKDTKAAILAQALSESEQYNPSPLRHDHSKLLAQPATWRNAGYIIEDIISPEDALRAISSLPLSSFRLQNDARETAIVSSGESAHQMRTRRHIGYIPDDDEGNLEGELAPLYPSSDNHTRIDFTDASILASLSIGATRAIAETTDTIHTKLNAMDDILPSLTARIDSIRERVGQSGDGEYKSIRQLAYEALALEAEASSKEIAVISHRLQHSVRMKVLETKSASKLHFLEEQTASLDRINAAEGEVSSAREVQSTDADANLDCVLERIGAVHSVTALRNVTKRELELVSEAASAEANSEKARIKEEAKSEREQEQASLERIIITGEETRKQAVEVIAAIVSYARDGLHHVVSTADGKWKCVLMATVAAALVFSIASAKESISLVFASIRRFLTTPRLIREYGRQRWYQPFGYSRCRVSNEDAFQDVVLASRTKDRIVALAKAAQNARRHDAPFRHVILHGPPGTGKSMVARKLAQCTGMDYAIMSGGDVGPIGADGVTEIHSIFKWAKSSRRGVLLFIDEAECFLGNRKQASKMSEHTHNALNALLYNTGGERRDFMLVLSTNRPQDLDSAVLDRCDEFISLPLPDVECRETLLAQYFKTFVIDEVAKVNARADGIVTRVKALVTKQEPFRIDIDENAIDSEQLASFALAMEGMSGREIGKIMIALQAALHSSSDGRLTRQMTEKILRDKLQEHRAKLALKGNSI